MRWRLTYTLRSYSITEDESLWTDTNHTWNLDRVESDTEAAEKTKVFLESILRNNGSVQSYKLVRIVQEEVAVTVQIPRLKTYTELKRPKKLESVPQIK